MSLRVRPEGEYREVVNEKPFTRSRYIFLKRKTLELTVLLSLQVRPEEEYREVVE